MDLERSRLEDALETLGDLLMERGQRVGLLVIGGTSLLLLGYIERPTADVDVVGVVEPGGYAKTVALPQFLEEAVGEVGRALRIGDRWLNVGPAGLIDFGLPEGTAARVSVRRYGALEVHLPAREDLVCFKLYALVDQGPRSKHMSDLRALAPSREELVNAARWTRTHDPSVEFLGELGQALALFDVEVHDGDL
jgi:hypothetical protein